MTGFVMRNCKDNSIAIGIFVALLSLISTCASARTAHVHAGPGPNWVKTAEIPSGTFVKVGSCKAGWGHHDWCKVTYKGKTGFIHEGALKPSGKHAVVAPVVTTTTVTLRSRASSNSDVIASLKGGEQINVAHCSDGWLKGWCRVNHEDHSGFVKGSFLKRE